MENEITYNNEFNNQRLEILTGEINFYANQIQISYWEIGKRLKEIKANLPHGEYGLYLEKIKFTYDTANQLVTIYDNIPNYDTYRNLNKHQLLLIAKLPEQEREAFVKDNDIENKSVRETERLIKEKKELEIRTLQLMQENNELKNQKPEPIIKIKEVEVIPAHIKTQMENMKRSLANSEKAYMKAEKELQELTQLKAEKETIENARTEYLKIKVKLNDFNKAIEDMKLILMFVDKFDKFYHSEMMPIATIIKPEKVNDNVRKELQIRIENLNNWLFAINQKFNQG